MYGVSHEIEGKDWLEGEYNSWESMFLTRGPSWKHVYILRKKKFGGASSREQKKILSALTKGQYTELFDIFDRNVDRLRQAEPPSSVLA